MTAFRSTTYDLWRLASPPDDGSGDVTYCEGCSDLVPRADLSPSGYCDDCRWDNLRWTAVHGEGWE